MAVGPVYEFTVPAPDTDYFEHGEKALSVTSSLGAAVAQTNYFLSKWFDFEGGEYLMRVVAYQASSWAVASTRTNALNIHLTTRGKDPHEVTLHLPRGRHRLDLILSNLASTAQSVYVVFSLFRQGRLVYASADDGWVRDTAPIDDEDVPSLTDERLGFPVFAVLPNWAHGVLERLTYSTEALMSESDAEQRRSLLLAPRRQIEAHFDRHHSVRARVDNFLSGVGRGKMLMPVWHEQYILSGTLTDTVVFPDGTLVQREFRAGGLALVMNKDASSFEVLEITGEELEEDEITFADAPIQTWLKGSRLFPLRVARVLEDSTMNNLTSTVGMTGVRFAIDESEPLWYEATWGSANLFQFRVDYGQGVTVRYDSPTAFVTQNEFGPVDVYDSARKARINIQLALQFRGRAAVHAFRQFIDMARGRAVRFWAPTFTVDAELTGDIAAGTEIDVRSIGLVDYFRTTQTFRNMVRLEFNDGSPHVYRGVIDFTRVSASVERIHLGASIGATLASVVRRISFVMPARFDHDTFEIQHLVDGGKASRSAVTLRSTDLDEMPPLED